MNHAVSLLDRFVRQILVGRGRPVHPRQTIFGNDVDRAPEGSGTKHCCGTLYHLDSFALRHPDLQATLQVFELDHPDTQQAKRARLLALDIELPRNLEFVGIDFEHQTVADGLRQSSYQPEHRTFFSWLGTTPYLTNAATLSTLASIAEFAAAGSEVVFDYLIPEAALSRKEARMIGRLKRFTARRGEPLVGEFDPDELKEVLRTIGLELIENLSGAEQERRYFANRRDGMRPTAASCIAHTRVASRAT